ncbi:MAG: AMP-binding protein [Burkholderiales bacterium]
MQNPAFDSLPKTLFEAFLDAAKTYGRARRILQDIKGEQSYGQLLKTSLALGRLACRMSREREIVGVLLPNLAATVGLLLGLSAMRRVPAMLNYSSGAEAVRGACAAAAIRTVITSREFLETAKLQALVQNLAGVKLIYMEDWRKDFTFFDKLWLLRALWRPSYALRAGDSNATAVVLYTSGSEGKPKGVALSHKALLSNIAQIRAVVDVVPEDRFLNALPIYHSYGLTACTLLPLFGGAHVFLYVSPLHYRTIPELARTHGSTFLFGTSTFLGEYAKAAQPQDFASLRYVISGAEKLSEEVAELWLDKFGVRIMEGYGATECAPVIAVNSNNSYRQGTVGRFVPGMEYRLQKVTGIEHGGLLRVRGPNLMRGYYLQEQPGELQMLASKFGPHWYNTGDVVEIDADGFVTVVGRIKRFAKVAGEMVSLEMVEKIARCASPQHQHAAVIHVVPESGESTMLFTTDSGLNRMQLHAAAKQLGAQDLAVARKIVQVKELPLLGNGKTDYFALQLVAAQAAA